MDTEVFKNNINYLRDKLNLQNFKSIPTMIFSKNMRNALYFTLLVHLSLLSTRVLDYSIVTGQTLINQHFLTEKNKDIGLHNNMHYTDVLFISLSQYDYTNEYLESLIVDLVEFRKSNNSITIISYDIMDNATSGYTSLTQKMQNYFKTNNYQLLDITGKRSSTFDAAPKPKKEQKSKPANPRRII